MIYRFIFVTVKTQQLVILQLTANMNNPCYCTHPFWSPGMRHTNHRGCPNNLRAQYRRSVQNAARKALTPTIQPIITPEEMKKLIPEALLI
jgi:hypothetical protein